MQRPEPALFGFALLLAAPLRADAGCRDWFDRVFWGVFWQEAKAGDAMRCLDIAAVSR